MAIWNLGSVASYVLTQIDNVPASVSGALIETTYQQVLYAEGYTGRSIGSTSIAEQYQPALIDLTMSAVLKSISIQGVDASSISLGDFSIDKGASSNTLTMADALRKSAEDKLSSIGAKIHFYKALG